MSHLRRGEGGSASHLTQPLLGDDGGARRRSRDEILVASEEEAPEDLVERGVTFDLGDGSYSGDGDGAASLAEHAQLSDGVAEDEERAGSSFTFTARGELKEIWALGWPMVGEASMATTTRPRPAIVRVKIVHPTMMPRLLG